MSNLRRTTGWVFVVASLLIHALTVWCYAKQPDTLAAFTVLPLWFWGGIGLLLSVFAFCFLRAPLSLILTAVWAITLSVAMDEAKGLSNITHPKIQQKRNLTNEAPTTLRVATVNCAKFKFGDPSPDLREWAPDIVFLQEVHPYRVKQISELLYGGKGDYRAHLTSGIITRHEITQEVRNSLINNQQVTIQLPSGRKIEAVNLHLTTAATDMRLWSRKARNEHRKNREIRRNQLSVILQILEQTSSFPNIPTILGGDFNAGATDVVHRQLNRDFEDSFGQVGRGWGNTFHRRLPILRIDHIYGTRQFQPISSGVIVSKKTDHRIVISDFILRE